MGDAQVIFRVDEGLLKRLDRSLKVSGFKTRNEWFRHEVRGFLEDAEKKKAMKVVERLTVEGMTEEDVISMVREWRERWALKGNGLKEQIEDKDRELALKALSEKKKLKL